jgi:hypothetical protein
VSILPGFGKYLFTQDMEDLVKKQQEEIKALREKLNVVIRRFNEHKIHSDIYR